MEARVGEQRRVERADRHRVLVVGVARASAGGAAAPQDVVGDDERVRREARDELLEVGRVLGLERVDEGELERPVQRRFALAERGQRPGVDHRDPVVGDPRVPPELAGLVGPRAVRVDRHDRAVVRLAERQPQRRVADRRADLHDPPPAGGEHLQHPPRVARDDRNSFRLAGLLDLEERALGRCRQRLDPVEVGRIGDPVTVVFHRHTLPRARRPRPAPCPLRPAGRHRSRGPPRGSSRRRPFRR